MNKFVKLSAIILFLSLFLAQSIYAATSDEKQLSEFINQQVKQLAPLEKELNITEWNAYISGSKEDYEKSGKATLSYNSFLNNKENYTKLIDWKKSGKINDPTLKRQLDILINLYGPNQISEELMVKISEKQSELAHKFNNYRGEINGKTVSERDIYDILAKSTDREERKAAWEAQKGVGPVVSKELIELVKLRNEGARQLGFKNYYEMQIAFADQDIKELENIFSKLVTSTETSFKNYKALLDDSTRAKFGISDKSLMPWDYQNPFFQSADSIFSTDNTGLFKERNLPLIAYNFYDGIGLGLGNVLKYSDLYEKEGKSQHAFCFDMDRSGDTRILMNLRNDEDSMSTLLHESGHAIYNLYIDRSMPWLFRAPSHTLTTECSAMLFERMPKTPQWLVKNLGAKEEEALKISAGLKKDQSLGDLIFCRWTVVMFNFEKSMYENPDQDLNKLWRDLVLKYQHITIPEDRNMPDWASKIHLVTSPVYYHNYMLANLMVSQVLHTIGTKILKTDNWTVIDFTGNKEAGRFMKEQIFRPGAKYNWNELIKRATGEYLNPDYFAKQTAFSD